MGKLVLTLLIMAAVSPIIAAIHGWVLMEKKRWQPWKDVEFYPVWGIAMVLVYGLVNVPA